MAKKNKIIREPHVFASVNWAIVSHLKPHQLAYRIDEACGWTMQRLKNLNANQRTKKTGFALYNFRMTELDPDFYLLALKDDQEILVKDLKQFDYLLQVRLPDEETRWDAEGLMFKLRNIENIVGVFDITIDNLKGADILFFDKDLDHLEIEAKEIKELKIKRIVK
jgi:hypothetical protein